LGTTLDYQVGSYFPLLVTIFTVYCTLESLEVKSEISFTPPNCRLLFFLFSNWRTFFFPPYNFLPELLSSPPDKDSRGQVPEASRLVELKLRAFCGFSESPRRTHPLSFRREVPALPRLVQPLGSSFFSDCHSFFSLPVTPAVRTCLRLGEKEVSPSCHPWSLPLQALNGDDPHPYHPRSREHPSHPPLGPRTITFVSLCFFESLATRLFRAPSV